MFLCCSWNSLGLKLEARRRAVGLADGPHLHRLSLPEGAHLTGAAPEGAWVAFLVQGGPPSLGCCSPPPPSIGFNPDLPGILPLISTHTVAWLPLYPGPRDPTCHGNLLRGLGAPAPGLLLPGRRRASAEPTHSLKSGLPRHCT